jgi:N-carbamoyl-L-amino-acid hydrolase
MAQSTQPGLERILADLEQLACLSADGPGVSRVAYSPEDAQGRAWFAKRCHDIGLTFEVDRFGNCFGWPTNTGRALLVGSHLDSVPQGGRYDGALGVVFGFEIARRALEHRSETPVAVAAFACEESVRFGIGAVGSRLLVGDLASADLDSVRDVEGTPLSTVLREAGLGEHGTVDLPARAAAYLELHVDQGSTLTSAGALVGIVPAIAGTIRTRITWDGEASHSGAHARNRRSDALISAASFLMAADATWAALEAAGETVALTVGKLNVEPNSPNTVPGRVEALVDLRSADAHVLATTQTKIEELAAAAAAAARTTHTIERLGAISGVAMDRGLIGALERAAQSLDISSAMTPSLAGHDAGVVAALVPSAMLFVANPAGVSHSPNEAIDPDSLDAALRVVEAALPELVA